jgi:hypothetical protein
MLMVSCDGCRTAAFVDCTCPEGHDRVASGHLPAVVIGGVTVPACPLLDLGAAVKCQDGTGCCTEDHSHDAAANSCPDIGLDHGQRHDGAPCPVPGNCTLWRNVNADHHRALREAGQPVPSCPGGHCGPGVPGCTVCRPVTITVIPGSVTAAPAFAVNGG